MTELDNHRTEYRVEIRWSPMQELLTSIEAFSAKSERSTMDLGAGWAREVRKRITPDLAGRADQRHNIRVGILGLCTLQPDAPATPQAFCAWMAELSVGELYERGAAFHESALADLPMELGVIQRETVDLVRDWNEQYFRHVDSEILTGLVAEVDRQTARLPVESPIDLIEELTGGVRFVPTEPADVVLLIPQYHFRPWNIYGHYGTLWLFRYPADVLTANPGDPPISLLRATRALADESRLRILRHLTTGTCSFTDLVRLMGLSKSTVHHHLVILRAAGLVRLEHADEKSRMYSLRPGVADGVAERIRSYLSQEGRA